MSKVNPEQQRGTGVCAKCGQLITHAGPDGECLRCLVSFGFLAGEDGSASSGAQPRLTLLRYAHFEVEVNADGYPKILGSGAMAVTYCARDTILKSKVALKVISRKLAENSTARARFLREARAAASIHHPNVARVIHYGEQDGECFYAMELVHGETLEARVRREGPLPLSLALEVVEQTARGLAAGEECGVIHRDLKPSNLMIESHAGDQLLVKIIDYGIAKVMAAQTDATNLTQAGFIGTPAFASPEQFDETGRQKIDTRSDIYSLGVTFWYLVTGQMPFAGRSTEEVRAKQAEELPLKQLKNAHVPLECVTLLKSVLAIDPGKRPQTARELLTQVHRCWQRFEPVARRRRKRLVIASTGLAVGAALLLLASFVYQRMHSSSELDRSIAVLPFENLSSNPDDHFLATGIQDEILTKLASLADLKVIARTSTASYETKPVDLRTVGRQLGVGRVLEGSLQRSADKVRVNVQLIDTRTNAHVWASSYDRKLDDVFAVETEVANAIAQQLDAKLVQRISTERPTANTAAYNAYLRGLGIEQGQSNIPSFQNAATAYAEAVKLDPDFALAWARLTLVQSFLYYNGVDRNVNSAAAVKEAADRALALAPELGEAWLAQGTYLYRVAHDLPGALEAYREAEKRLPNSSLVNEYMVYVERRLGHWREAETHVRRATDLDPRNFRLWARTAADDVFGDLRRFSEAEAAVDRALEISPGDQYGIIVKTLLFQYQGRLNEAARQLARLPKDSTDKTVLLVRATQALLERNFEQVIFYTEEATKSVSSEKPLSTQDALGLVYQGYAQKWTGRSEEARATFERMIQAMAPAAGAAAGTTYDARSLLAFAYAGIGEKEKALEQANQAVADYNNDTVNKVVAENFRAQIQASFGETDAAIAAVAHLLKVPGGVYPGDLSYSPFWDPLRKDPRFQALVKNPPPVRY